MLFPNVASRIEKQCLFSSTRINVCRLFAFGDIAMRAGETKILQNTLPTFKARNNVINMKRLPNDNLWRMAIFTSSGRSSHHLRRNLRWYFRAQAQTSLRFDFTRLENDPFNAWRKRLLIGRPCSLNNSGRRA